MKSLILLVVSSLLILCSLADDVQNVVDDVTTTKEGDMFCPVPIVGTKCPGNSILHYYKCCGELSKDCCFNLQTWVIVLLTIIAVVIFAGFILSLIRCLFCRR